MKIGINMLLWTGHVTHEHAPILRALKETGFDGVEIPIFDASDAGHYGKLGALLDDIGLARTAVAVIPDEEHSPISDNPTHRQGAVDHLKSVIDCCSALSAKMLVGPYYQPLGIFSGEFPSETELNRCADVHRQIVSVARAAGIGMAFEPLNRFEAHLLNTVEQSIAYTNRVAEAGFGILYDTFHVNIEEKDPLAALDALHAAGALSHIHISENDRGTPGKGHAKIGETIIAAKALGYDGWLVIEAFGRAVPELAAATRVWRDFFPNPEEVYTEGYRFIKDCWET